MYLRYTVMHIKSIPCTIMLIITVKNRNFFFCGAFVDPKRRKFEMKAYKIIIEGIPKQLPRLRLASIFWAFRAKPSPGGFC